MQRDNSNYPTRSSQSQGEEFSYHATEQQSSNYDGGSGLDASSQMQYGGDPGFLWQQPSNNSSGFGAIMQEAIGALGQQSILTFSEQHRDAQQTLPQTDDNVHFGTVEDNTSTHSFGSTGRVPNDGSRGWASNDNFTGAPYDSRAHMLMPPSSYGSDGSTGHTSNNNFTGASYDSRAHMPMLPSSYGSDGSTGRTSNNNFTGASYNSGAHMLMPPSSYGSDGSTGRTSNNNFTSASYDSRAHIQMPPSSYGSDGSRDHTSNDNFTGASRDNRAHMPMPPSPYGSDGSRGRTSNDNFTNASHAYGSDTMLLPSHRPSSAATLSSMGPPPVPQPASQSTSRMRGQKQQADKVPVSRATARSTSRSRGKKRQVDKIPVSRATAQSDNSKRSSKKTEGRPTQLAFYNGEVTPHDLVIGIFFSLIHGVVIDNTFTTFSKTLFEDLLVQAGRIFEEDNPEHAVPSVTLTPQILAFAASHPDQCLKTDVETAMETVLHAKKNIDFSPSYSMVDGTDISGVDSVNNEIKSNSFLEMNTMPFANLVNEGKIVENLATPQLEEIVSNVLYVNAPETKVGPSIPVGLVLRQSRVSLRQYAHSLVITYHCLEQFRFGSRMSLSFDEATYGYMRIMLDAEMPVLERDRKLSNRRTKLHQAATGQLMRPAAMTHLGIQTFQFNLNLLALTD